MWPLGCDNGGCENAGYTNPDWLAITEAELTLGLHRVMFAVDDIDDTVVRLQGHGAEVLGEVAQYEDIYRLCYLRGPEGIIFALVERLG